MKIDGILLEVIGNTFMSIAEEMGAVLVKSAYSTNIKERKDCSCALFDAEGHTIAQAEHIPMHLGSAVFAKDIDKQMSPIISFLLTGVLPLILFIALGNYMAKKLMAIYCRSPAL